MAARQEVFGMFGGLTPSKGAVAVVEKALRLGIDPTDQVSRAVEATRAGGKSKVCVKPESPLDSLRGVVVARRFQSQQGPRLR